MFDLHSNDSPSRIDKNVHATILKVYFVNNLLDSGNDDICYVECLVVSPNINKNTNKGQWHCRSMAWCSLLRFSVFVQHIFKSKFLALFIVDLKGD